MTALGLGGRLYRMTADVPLAKDDGGIEDRVGVRANCLHRQRRRRHGDLRVLVVAGLAEGAACRRDSRKGVEAVAAGARHDVRDPASRPNTVDQRIGPLVIVAVAGEYQADVLRLEKWDEILLDGSRAGIGRGGTVRRPLQDDDPPGRLLISGPGLLLSVAGNGCVRTHCRPLLVTG